MAKPPDFFIVSSIKQSNTSLNYMERGTAQIEILALLREIQAVQLIKADLAQIGVRGATQLRTTSIWCIWSMFGRLVKIYLESTEEDWLGGAVKLMRSIDISQSRCLSFGKKHQQYKKKVFPTFFGHCLESTHPKKHIPIWVFNTLKIFTQQTFHL